VGAKSSRLDLLKSSPASAVEETLVVLIKFRVIFVHAFNVLLGQL
jgi:hypothetical protein